MSDEHSSSRDTLKVEEHNLNPDSIGIYKRKPSKYLTRQVSDFRNITNTPVRKQKPEATYH